MHLHYNAFECVRSSEKATWNTRRPHFGKGKVFRSKFVAMLYRRPFRARNWHTRLIADIADIISGKRNVGECYYRIRSRKPGLLRAGNEANISRDSRARSASIRLQFEAGFTALHGWRYCSTKKIRRGSLLLRSRDIIEQFLRLDHSSA